MVDIMTHAKEMAAAIISKQNGTYNDNNSNDNLIDAKRTFRKKTRTIGPDTQIRVGINNPATIISETNSGGIEEFLAISPDNHFYVTIQSNGGKTKLNQTWTQLSAISSQASDIGAFQDADGNYILNIKNYRWQEDMVVILGSTSGSFLFNQVYANWYVFGE